MTQLSAIKLTLQLVEREGGLDAAQERLLRRAISMADAMAAELRDPPARGADTAPR
jgi:hypothetical protein